MLLIKNDYNSARNDSSVGDDSSARDDGLVVFNSLSWERDVLVELPSDMWFNAGFVKRSDKGIVKRYDNEDVYGHRTI